eukprot:scaffold22373_cov78-Cyclotella_meneghiniana.AAC.2
MPSGTGYGVRVFSWRATYPISLVSTRYVEIPTWLLSMYLPMSTDLVSAPYPGTYFPSRGVKLLG